jgi:hypothetical protein
MACLFCGKTRKLSREHLWPQWVLRTIPRAERRGRIEHSLVYHDRPTKFFQAPIFSATLKDVCAPCNNGWMSQIEAEAKPHASALLIGEKRTLAPEAQKALAVWAYLKVLLLERVDQRQRLIPEPIYNDLYETRADPALPPIARAYTAAYVGPLKGQYAHRGLTSRSTAGPSIDAFLGTFMVRRLVLQIFVHFGPGATSSMDHPSVVASRVRQIWPGNGDLLWPPGRPLDPLGLALFAGPEPK